MPKYTYDNIGMDDIDYELDKAESDKASYKVYAFGRPVGEVIAICNDPVNAQMIIDALNREAAAVGANLPYENGAGELFTNDSPWKPE